jgi:hypothetical protein
VYSWLAWLLHTKYKFDYPANLKKLNPLQLLADDETEFYFSRQKKQRLLPYSRMLTNNNHMKQKHLFLTSILYVLFIHAGAQQYKVALAGFYNCENFYDTINDPLTNDEEFLPESDKHYNTAVYRDKVSHLARVIAEMGTDISPDGVALLGLAEIENDTVLSDLVHHPLLVKRNYQVVHYNSKDARGVDVAFLYNPRYFTLQNSRRLFVWLPAGSKNSFFTRDILWVKGKLDGEPVCLYINHWPSRRGGEERSSPARDAAATRCKTHLDSIQALEPGIKILVMGDLNDDPVSHSITGVLGAKGKIKEVKPGTLFNPWMELFKKGIGTLAYQDAWGLFDQIILNQAWLPRNQEGFFYYQAHVFSKPYMIENTGKYKGYPMRTWDGNHYRGGYSDHFPTYLVLLKKKP